MLGVSCKYGIMILALIRLQTNKAAAEVPRLTHFSAAPRGLGRIAEPGEKGENPHDCVRFPMESPCRRQEQVSLKIKIGMNSV